MRIHHNGNVANRDFLGTSFVITKMVRHAPGELVTEANPHYAPNTDYT
jgi:hypothetical protein